MTAKVYPPGVPCWVETLHPDPRAALAFYHELFGWDASEPWPMPDGGEYYVARFDDADVAGIATLPPGGIAEPAWTTYIGVDDLHDTVQCVVSAGGRVIVAPLDAAPAGRLAIVEAPTGATFGLWEPGERAGAQRINEPGAWAMSTLRTRDLATATAFYAQVFGWQIQPFSMGVTDGVLLRLPGYVGGLARQPVPRDVVAVAMANDRVQPEHWSVGFWIDDLDAALTRVALRGGTIIVPAKDAPPFRSAVIACPAGAVFTISQLMQQP